MSDSDVDIIVKGKDEASRALKGAGDAVDDLGDKGTKASGAMGGLASVLGGPVLAAAGVVVGALLGVGTAAFSMASDMDDALRTLRAQLGLTQTQAQDLKPMIEDVFSSGLVSSANEGAHAIAIARQQFRGLADEELGDVAKQALLISNQFGDDYGKVLNSAYTLTKQFGIGWRDAYNMIIAGYQQGLNASGDWTDSIGEYSNQWAAAGASASEFFSAQLSGIQGGVLGLDKMNDAFKEFNIRIQDGSDTTRNGLNALLGATGDVDVETASLKGTLDTLEGSLKASEQAMSAAEDTYERSQERVSVLKDALSEAQAALSALGNSDLAGMREIDDQLFGLQQEATKLKLAMIDMVPDSRRIQQLERDLDATTQALHANEDALDSAHEAYDTSKESVDTLAAALNEARQELDALGSPNLAGMREIDDQITALNDQAVALKRSMLDMVPNDTRIQQLERDLSDATRAVDDNADALQNAEGAYATSKQQVDELRDALQQARQQLDDLSRPNLAGMEEFDDKIFSLEHQINGVRLAMVGLDKDSPAYDTAKANLEDLTNQLDRLNLERDLTYDWQLRDIGKAAQEGQKPVVTYSEALEQIANKKNEIAGLEGTLNGANTEMQRNADTVERLSQSAELLSQHVSDLQQALENAKAPTAEYEAAAQALDAINLQIDRLTLDRQIQFEPQLRGIQQAAEEGQQPAVTYAEALQAIADKKNDIASLEAAFSAANATMQANETTIDALTTQHEQLALSVDSIKEALEAAKGPTAEFVATQQQLDGINTQMDRLAMQRDLQFEPQLRAIQDALATTNEPALNLDQTLQRIGERQVAIADLETALADAETQTSGNRDRVNELKDQQELYNQQIADTKTALENVVTPADQLLAKLADGEITQKDLFDLVLDRLGKVPDKLQQNQLGVALLGSQWEDSTADAILGVDTTGTRIDDLKGRTEDLQDASNTLGSEWSKMWNEMKLELLPLGSEMVKLAKENLPEVKEAMKGIADFLNGDFAHAMSITVDWVDKAVKGFGAAQFLLKSIAMVGLGTSPGNLNMSVGAIDPSFAEWLKSLDSALPDWLRPGSPTPFEIGLKGIRQEMGDLARTELPAFRTGLDVGDPLLPNLNDGIGGYGPGGYGPGGSGLTLAPVIQGSVVTERDLMTMLIDLLRQYSNSNGGLETMGIKL